MPSWHAQGQFTFRCNLFPLIIQKLFTALMAYVSSRTGSLAYFADIGHLTDRFAWQQAAQHLPFFLLAVSQGPYILFHCFSNSIKFILTIFKEGAGLASFSSGHCITLNKHSVHCT
jgi:hypothetical protein